LRRQIEDRKRLHAVYLLGPPLTLASVLIDVIDQVKYCSAILLILLASCISFKPNHWMIIKFHPDMCCLATKPA
jgi:hypothetical protein